ncbi:MGMT family protein [Paenibacillus oenotherae]|uniref:MGMT family protein n=1 Tax=Paenibacillus oenotherae TaxID=1435645 RepID=A0ABS7D609_9BACL|nr:MGMT family protein [Paenibacillus oenotherae]MBW7475379.1 MGMT family protein [Paenibacillus oenotherae]
MQPFTQKVIETIKAIPEGYVMTYGGIAEFAGSRRGARQVVRILHSLSAAHGLPWHRVVNVKGEIAIKDDEARYMQKLYLINEGVLFDDNGQVDLERCRFIPEG